MKKTPLKKDDARRKWRSFKKNAGVLLRPFILAILTTGLWAKLHPYGYHFHHEDTSVLTEGGIATLAVLFGLIAAVVLNAIWERYRQIVVAVLKKDRETFLLYRDERIPIMLHLLLLSFSLPLWCIIVALEYRSLWSGSAVVFAVTFSLALFWVVATELENPAQSPWFAERIPQDWLKVDIDKHFEQGQE